MSQAASGDRDVRVAVIGGTGCGGAAVVRALAEAGARVLVISRGVSACPPPGIEWAPLDRHDTEALRCALGAFEPETLVDQIVYTAAESEALGQALPQSVRRVIVASSAIVYGADRRGLPYDEDAPLTPDDPFAQTKAAADVAARTLPSATVLRLGMLYGPGQAPLTPLGREPRLRERLLAGEPLPVPADDPPRLQPLFAPDYGELIRRLLETEKSPPALNVTGDETFSWGALLSAWATAWGTPSPRLEPIGHEALAARAPPYLRRFLPSLLAPTRVSTARLRACVPEWRPHSLGAGLQELLTGSTEQGPARSG